MKYQNLFIDCELPEPLSDKELKDYMKELEKGNIQIKKILIEHNIRLVISQVVNKFDNIPYDKEELVSIGLVGLIKAVNTFDYTKNFKFTTYAVKCINNEIFMYIRKNNKNNNAISLDQNILISNDSKVVTQKELLIDESVDIVLDYERKETFEFIKKALANLTDLERKIIMLYFGFINDKRYTQLEIAKMENISHTYVYKLIKRGLKKIEIKLRKESIIEISSNNSSKKIKK